MLLLAIQGETESSLQKQWERSQYKCFSAVFESKPESVMADDLDAADTKAAVLTPEEQEMGTKEKIVGV